MRLLTLTLTLILLAAHSAWAQKVVVEFDTATDFSKFKTFVIRDGRLNSKNPALNSELVQKRIDADLERGLAAKGLVRASFYGKFPGRWCGRGDSNPHALASVSPSSWCVCQFRHFRT